MSKSAQKQAHDAFEAYVLAKRRVDQSLTFADAQAAARAWVSFLNAYLGPEDQMPLPTAKVLRFPGHYEGHGDGKATVVSTVSPNN